MSETVLVTGGTGFIAGWCIVELLKRGYTVRTTVRNLAKESAVRTAIAPALAQANAATSDAANRLTFFPADLTSDNGWDHAAAGCDYVLHVASPLGLDAPKDPNTLIRPARDGALRVLRAATKTGVKRVVMTSSVAAASPPPESADSFTDETLWTDPAAPNVDAYSQSKVIAEKAAWDFITANGTAATAATTLTTILPSYVLGPVLLTENFGSVQVVQRLLNGSLPGNPRLGFSFVDVRDLADLHICAMSSPAAAGQRFIASTHFMWMADISQTLRVNLGTRASKVPTRSLPDFVLRLAAIFDRPLRLVTPGLGKQRTFSSAKAVQLFGWTSRPAVTTVIDCAESILACDATRHSR